MTSASRFFSYKVRQFAPLLYDLMDHFKSRAPIGWVNSYAPTPRYLGKATDCNTVLLLQEFVLWNEKLTCFMDNYKKIINLAGPKISKNIQNILNKSADLTLDLLNDSILDGVLSQRLDFWRPMVQAGGDFFEFALAVCENHCILSFLRRYPNFNFSKTLRSIEVGKDYLLKNFMEHIVHLQFEDDLQNLVSLLNGYQQTWLEFFIANSEREPLETVFSDFLDMNKKYARKGSRPVTDRELYYWLSGNRDNENGNLINLCDDLCDSMEKMTYPGLVSVLLDENAEIQRPIFHKPPKWSMISRKKPKENFEVWAVPTYGLKKKLFGLHDRLESLFGWLSEVKDAESFPKIVMVITNQWQPGAIDRHLENIFKWRDKDIDFKFMLAQESGLGLTQIPVGF